VKLLTPQELPLSLLKKRDAKLTWFSVPALVASRSPSLKTSKTNQNFGSRESPSDESDKEIWKKLLKNALDNLISTSRRKRGMRRKAERKCLIKGSKRRLTSSAGFE